MKEWIYFRKKLYHDLIVVPVDGTRQYMLVDGERRYRAILSLNSEQYSEVFPMGINCDVISHMSDILGIKERQLKNYINTARLIPEFEEMLQEGRITLREAVRFSALDNDSQMYLLKKYSDDGSIASS